jgi:SanA protein
LFTVGKCKNKKRRVSWSLLGSVAFIMLTILAINLLVINTSTAQIVSEQEAFQRDADCILILGAGVINNERPSSILRDRLLTGVKLYHHGTANKLLMSGDNGQKGYDEVNVMKKFAMDRGIPSYDIFMDHAGFSTYESIYRAKKIFEAEKIIIVTQEYHMHRALYIAKKLGLNAVGVHAAHIRYSGANSREFREILARVKDYFICIIKPSPKYLGEKIPIGGDGDITNDS